MTRLAHAIYHDYFTAITSTLTLFQ